MVYDREVLTWQQSEPISPDATTGTGGIWGDADVYSSLLATRTVTRGTRSWVTTHEYHTGLGNFNDYGRPWRTTEDGELDRTITRTFTATPFAPYILPQLAREVISPNGFESNVWYDFATGFVLERTLGQLLPGSPIHRFEAWPNGNLKAAIDPVGNRTEFLYAWGRVSKVTTPGIVTDYSVNPNGTVAWEETGLLRTNYDYDIGLRLKHVKPPNNTTWTEYTYDDSNAGFVTVTRAPSVVTSYLDGFGRVRSTVDQTGVTSRVERDACGRTSFQSYAYTTGSGVAGVSTSYDPLNRPVAVTDGSGTPNPATTHYAYPVGAVVITDPQNRSTKYEYSAFADPGDARLTLVWDADNKLTRYTYDAFGNLARVNGPNATGLFGSAPERTWWYDDNKNLLMSDSQPERGVTSYVTDLAGNVRQITDAAGTTTLHYDGNNRLWKRDAPGTADDLEIHYNAAGQVDNMASPTIAAPTTRITYGYDLAGRVSWRTDLVNGYTFGSSYTYLSNDAPDEITYPTTRKVKYTYDALGRLAAVKNNATTFADTFTYDSQTGRLKSYKTGSVVHEVTFDARQRVATMKSGTSVDPALRLDLTYGYDAASQIETITDPRAGMSQTFYYDFVGRMWSADGPWGALRWTYDPAGNRKSETRAGGVTTYHYNDATQRLASTSGAIAESFTYDNIGRLWTDSRGVYTYNSRSLLATATQGSVSASYGYDPAGLRSMRTVNGHTTYSVRGAGGTVLTEYATMCGALTWQRDTIYIADRPLGAVRANTAPITVAVTAATASVTESQSSVQVGVRLTKPGGGVTACPVTVAFETTTGTATYGADLARTGGTLVFAAGIASGTVQNVTIPLIPDSVNEPLETFTLLLSTATGAEIAGPAGQVVTIVDDELAPAMAIEAPTAGASLKTPFTVSGWAIDESVTTGTGVDLIHVHTTPAGGSPVVLGAASYGGARSDIAALYNATRFTNSGFTFLAHVPPGPSVLTVYARNASTGAWNQAQTVAVTVAPAVPQMSLETPAAPWATVPQPFTMTGWAIDAGTSMGTGVQSVQILAYPNPGSGAPPVIVGNATYGGARPDVQSAYQQYGSGFTPSGFSQEIRGLTPGVYRLVAQALSTVTGTYNQSREITVTVAANPAMWVDAPASGTAVNQTFTMMGWAIDAAAATGTGVNTVHVWATPNPGSGAPAVFLGAAPYGSARGDVAAGYGSQFLNSGWSLTTTLTPGVYQLMAYAYSLVSGGFTQAQSVTVTVATSQPAIAIDAPAAGATVGQPLGIAGWAVDIGAPAGTGAGMDVVHIYAIANSGAGAWTFLGAATYGGARPDVAAYFGNAQFTNSGYGLTASGLAPGTYQINVYAHSTVSGQWSVSTRLVTVQ